MQECWKITNFVPIEHVSLSEGLKWEGGGGEISLVTGLKTCTIRNKNRFK